jgi:hypothetical protein
VNPKKDETPTLPGDEVSSETPSSTKGNHMNIMTLQAQQPDGQPATMTSREMADLTEKRHDSVKRTIDTLAARGAISQPQIVDGPKSANGVVEQVYLVGKLTQLLQENSWVYRRPMGSGYLAYQDRIQQGLMEHKITTGEKTDGHEWTNTQARITPKGLVKLAEVIRQAGMH